MGKQLQRFELGKLSDFNLNMGSCVKVKGKQIAVFNYEKKQWYAIDNLCPHKKQMVLARGLMGSVDEEPKVSCPLHKRNFSLISGKCLSDKSCGNVNSYKIEIKNEKVYLYL